MVPEAGPQRGSNFPTMKMRSEIGLKPKVLVQNYMNPMIWYNSIHNMRIILLYGY